MLNSEPSERGNDLKPTIYDGSIGKIMPVVYVRGKLAHVGQIYLDLNPINLLSEIIRRTEQNTNFMEKVGTTTNPPPTWLYHKDKASLRCIVAYCFDRLYEYIAVEKISNVNNG